MGSTWGNSPDYAFELLARLNHRRQKGSFTENPKGLTMGGATVDLGISEPNRFLLGEEETAVADLML
jgi:hypothetical protein